VELNTALIYLALIVISLIWATVEQPRRTRRRFQTLQDCGGREVTIGVRGDPLNFRFVFPVTGVARKVIAVEGALWLEFSLLSDVDESTAAWFTLAEIANSGGISVERVEWIEVPGRRRVHFYGTR